MGPQEPQEPQVPPQEPQQPPTPPQPQFVPQPGVPPQQPQQFQQFQPVQMPQGAMPGGGAPMAPKKGLSKGVIWGIVGGAVGLLLIIVGVVLAVTVFGGPSKQDYLKANEKLNEAKSAYNDIGSLQYISTYSLTETTVKNDLEKLKTAKSTVDSTIEAFGKMKAVNDKDVKESYNKLKERMVKFDEMMTTSIEIYDKILPVMIDLNDATGSYTTNEAMLSSLTNVRKSLEGLDLTADINKTYVKGLIEQIKILEVVIPKKIAMNQDYTKYDASVNQQYYDASDKLNDLDSDWQSNIEKLAADGEVNDQINDLGDLLYDKYIGTKK